MATLGYVTATDLANALLPLYTRGDTLSQTTEDKPTLRWFEEHKKTFSGGLSLTLSDPVQGAFMSDTTPIQGYSSDDQLLFGQAMNIQRTTFYGYEHNYGLTITWSELKQDGITISNSQKITQHSEKDLYVLADIYRNRMTDFMESYQRNKNALLWRDGSADPKSMKGLFSILTDTPATGTTGGISRVTYPWWRHRMDTTLAPSPTDQTMCLFLQDELRVLKQFGGKPDKAVCGRQFLKALEKEVYAKGVLTQTGFQNTGKTRFGLAEISVLGLGTFDWDPFLDHDGKSDRCYILDSRRLKYRPMEDEDDKVLNPERPYNYAVFFHNITLTAAMTATQLNCHGIYKLAA